MEKHQDTGTAMILRVQLYFFVLPLLMACGQPSHTKAGTSDSSQPGQGKLIARANMVADTDIAILSNRQIDFFSLKDSLPATLNDSDLQTIERLLGDCIQAHNKNADSNRVYSNYIRKEKYNRQYVAYTGAHAAKKVFVNCFCKGIPHLDYWKEKLVMMDDGGICFFNITIDISNRVCGPILINGPG